MIEDQANRFAQRMIETWPKGPRRNVWRDIALKLHDPDAARQAYTDLEHTAPHISTAAFHAAYQAALRRHQLDTHTPGRCDMCDDTGWVDAPPRTHQHERTTTQVQSCRCTKGQAMKETQRRMYETHR